MKLPLLILSLLSLGVSQFAWSAANEDVEIISAPLKKQVYADSSEYNRMNKQYTGAVELLGVGPLGVLSNGYHAGLFIDRNSILQIEGTSTSLSTSFVDETKFSGYSIGLHYKHFFGNSFYVNGGIDQRDLERKEHYFHLGNDYSQRNFEIESTAASIVIGNQWQWSNFTLGCDWVGYTLPFRSSLKSEYISANAYDHEQSDVRSLEDDYGKKIIGQGLRFYLGASF